MVEPFHSGISSGFAGGRVIVQVPSGLLEWAPIMFCIHFPNRFTLLPPTAAHILHLGLRGTSIEWAFVELVFCFAHL